MKRKNIKYLMAMVLFQCMTFVYSQDYFNAWLTTCSHLVGPTGNPQSLKLAVEQSRGLLSGASGFGWDILIDMGDWTASQKPPGDEEGEALARLLDETLGMDRGRFFTVSGNHDGDAKGWNAGEFTKKYINPLGASEFAETSSFDRSQRPEGTDYRQLLNYPGTRWDRYLIRTGNVIWIMLGDRNEYDQLAESRGDKSGAFQAGRGNAAGMPNGGYPSGAVTLDTYEWWKQVVEDPAFSEDILITTHHLMLANTTITTEDGEPGEYHGQSGSLGPNGEIGGQLYWIREYNEVGNELHQYAQTRPFLNYLKDHPGAITAWVGGHSHIHTPKSKINERGIHVRKYEVSFISVGALTDSHAGGKNQLSRMLTFEEGKMEAIINVYIHKSSDSSSLGWYEPAARRLPLGKRFACPAISTNKPSPVLINNLETIPEAPEDAKVPRYNWKFDQDKEYDFNHENFIVGEDGSPYGVYEGVHRIVYSMDTPLGTGRSFDLGGSKGRVCFSAPYTPEMNWENMTMSVWLKSSGTKPSEVISYVSETGENKFRFWFDGEFWIWEMGNGLFKTKMKWKSSKEIKGNKWHHFVVIADSEANHNRLYVDGILEIEKVWHKNHLLHVTNGQLILGNSNNLQVDKGTEPYEFLVDELKVYDYTSKFEDVCQCNHK